MARQLLANVVEFDMLELLIDGWRHSQAVRQRSAKPLFPGSNPGVALAAIGFSLRLKPQTKNSFEIHFLSGCLASAKMQHDLENDRYSPVRF